MTHDQFHARYTALLEQYNERSTQTDTVKLYDAWRWFQAATMALLYEYNDSRISEAHDDP